MGKNKDINNDPLLEMFIFETNELLEQLVEILLEAEKVNIISEEYINEIFRIMHTIKGSSSMLTYNNISTVSHVVEDLFFLIRETKPQNINYSAICDVVLTASDFIKGQMSKVECGDELNDADENLIDRIKALISNIKSADDEGEKKYIVKILFDDECKMENIRAFSIASKLKDLCSDFFHRPADILDDDTSADFICQNGFEMCLTTSISESDINDLISKEIFIKNSQVRQVESYNSETSDLVSESKSESDQVKLIQENNSSINSKNNFFNVHVSKLDKLMDLVGEIVIGEKMIAKNPDLEGLRLDNFSKATRQFRKLTDELQDIVMSLRMVPIAATFNKMHRIVRDMCKKLGKDAELELIGEDTEVDKSIVDSLGDPLMHIIRNSMDHGIEDVETRVKNGKTKVGKITLEAKNTGEEVIIKISDDGKGLNREALLEKAREHKLIDKPENQLTDREVYNLILLPGFSTKEQVTEFSGRGVGMDVVRKNIEKVGGNVIIDSEMGKGSKITIRIPLTLAIIDGMEISVGGIKFILTTTSIIRIFRPNMNDVVCGTDNKEMIMIGEECLPVIRLSTVFNIASHIENLSEGILLLVESDSKTACIFADQLIGEQQVVVKPLPSYIAKYSVVNYGVAGCTILGNGSISLILDATRIINNEI